MKESNSSIVGDETKFSIGYSSGSDSCFGLSINSNFSEGSLSSSMNMNSKTIVKTNSSEDTINIMEKCLSSNNCNDDEIISISRIMIDRSPFYLLSQWADTSFELWLTDTSKCFYGKATAEFIKNNLKPVDVSLKEYIQLAEHALRTPDMNFTYGLSRGKSNSISNDGGKMEFSWGRKGTGAASGILFRSNLDMAPVESKDCLQRIFDHLIYQDTSNRIKLGTLSAGQISLQAQRDELVEALSNVTQDKYRIEEAMFQKFACVLNTKKQKIKKLKEQLKSK